MQLLLTWGQHLNCIYCIYALSKRVISVLDSFQLCASEWGKPSCTQNQSRQRVLRDALKYLIAVNKREEHLWN